MPSIFWYYGLAVIGLGIAFFTVYKKKDIATIATFIVFYLYATCITFVGEYFALAVFDGYAYKPGVFTDSFADSLVGHLILNSTLWSGTGILVGAFSLRYHWIFLISIAFILPEYLFIKLGIYEHHWWKFYMSGIVVFLYCTVVRIWFPKFNQHRHELPRYITLYFTSLLIIHAPISLLLIFEK